VEIALLCDPHLTPLGEELESTVELYFMKTLFGFFIVAFFAYLVIVRLLGIPENTIDIGQINAAIRFAERCPLFSF